MLPAIRVRPDWRGYSFRGSAGRRAVRAVVFLDYQNVYHGARDAFFSRSDPSSLGAVHPLALGRLLASRGLADTHLHQVRVYRGVPHPARDPRAHRAATRQVAAHQAEDPALVKHVLRPLQYPTAWPRERAREKGVDVALAVDFVAMALEGAFDVGVIVSTDTDLRPALEAITQRGRAPKCEVAAWQRADKRSPRLSIGVSPLWCHWLSRSDYEAVADRTNYARAS